MAFQDFKYGTATLKISFGHLYMYADSSLNHSYKDDYYLFVYWEENNTWRFIDTWRSFIGLDTNERQT